MLETNRVESHPTVDDAAAPLAELEGAEQARDDRGALCATTRSKSAELRERLRAVASMMSFLGVEAEPGPIGSGSTEGTVPEGSSRRR